MHKNYIEYKPNREKKKGQSSTFAVVCTTQKNRDVFAGAVCTTDILLMSFSCLGEDQRLRRTKVKIFFFSKKLAPSGSTQGTNYIFFPRWRLQMTRSVLGSRGV